MGKIRVVVADDHPSVREGIYRYLRDEKDFDIVARAANSLEALSLIEKLRPDVAVIDVSMPPFDGIELVKRIREACPETVALMISAYDYDKYILASLQAGAAGYLLKTAPLSELASAIRMVHAGETVLSYRTIRDIIGRLSTKDTQEHQRDKNLHRRELEVLKLTAKGFSNRQIARQLFISERTVQSHLVSIFRKLGVGSRTEAALSAVRIGWINLDDLP